MSNFKGNDGNLMQHWVLCELLAVARKDTTHLTFVDAHSMAPIAIERTEKRANRSGKFDAVFEHLPGAGVVVRTSVASSMVRTRNLSELRQFRASPLASPERLLDAAMRAG